MDHRQLEVRVGVVDRLPPRLGDDDEREGDGAESERRVRPDRRARRSGDHPGEARRPRDERADREREHERRLGRDGDGQVAARAHQREAVRDVPRRGGDGEAREREQAGEDEHVAADAEPGARPATGTSSTAAATLDATTAGAQR